MKSRLAMVALAAIMTTTLALSAVQPARADQAASTRDTIIGIALIAGALISANVANKNAVANTVVGNTRDGATVYQDGHVVLADGSTYYPNDNGQSISCGNGFCSIYGNGNAYAGNGYGANGYNPNQSNGNRYSGNQYNGNQYNGNGYYGNTGRGRDRQQGRR